ncbi:lysophospholipid acyltransferase family protein [Prevotella multiformis]|uniref:Lipid A biosynthesis (KDO)2-(Lauroyl)-lipid IVA acyltransferase n=1 Tax=Prevotella multiformis DSM 16608 TaxID=888743 RepID=F0F3U6_9BACT|nr:lysophospholipid acyltransferase family protein [Prevotella multiformis]EGC21226.1 lipid A biosynthesis (KDO)2-(lauroyl)-lipid IVA acyltransferase [Prevotella multiformis DSM 16608]
MKKAFYKTLYLLAYGFWYLLALLPFPVLYLFSDVFYLIMAHIVKYRHKVIGKNLRNSFPEKTDAELHRIEQGFYHWFCDYVVETFKLMTMSREQLMQRMTFTGTEELNRLLSEGRSVAIYLGHLGNWEWITSLPYWVEDSVCCQIYHPLENEYFDRLFKFVRERHDARCIPMQESLRKIIQFGRAGKPVVVGYISDQTPFWWNIHHWIKFLNQETPVLTGAERIVKHTRQVFVYGDVTRIRRGHYNCAFRIIREDTKSLPEYEITDLYFRELEKSIRRQPEIYLWSHNRWKRTRARFDEYFEEVNGKVHLREGKEMIF